MSKSRTKLAAPGRRPPMSRARPGTNRKVRSGGLRLWRAGLWVTLFRGKCGRARLIGQALAATRSGPSLHLQHREGRPLWSLSDDRSVTADVAAILIRDARVVPADAALFPICPVKRGGLFDE